jgi:hypothetical protein
VAARANAFPAPVLALLADLGIDSRCEAELCFTRHAYLVPTAFGNSPVLQLELVADVPRADVVRARSTARRPHQAHLAEVSRGLARPLRGGMPRDWADLGAGRRPVRSGLMLFEAEA